MGVINKPEPECSNCKFFAMNPYPAKLGACRRREPMRSVNEAGHGVWPGVHGTDWCGEYAWAIDRQMAHGESVA